MFLKDIARLVPRPTIPKAGIACLAFVLALTGSAIAAEQSGAVGSSGEQLITVLNPTGIAPEIERRAMAPRPDSLDGKTVYLVDVTFNGGDLFLEQMQQWMAVNMPNVQTEFRIKQGVYSADDPALWEEIQSVDGMMIMAIGH
jgi:hypothetical protein